MNFFELMNVAGSNKEEAQYQASVKRYSSQLPPPRKNQKSGVQSDGVRKFLEKKKAEEAARVAVALKQKEQLLALRAQNTKSNKKAKIMASRTKDNDFSRIKLTEDEIESKKKIEIELTRKHLATKVERMKARIEMEEKEKLLPRKRKRKSKHGEEMEDDSQAEERIREEIRDSRDNFKKPEKSAIRKPPRPPPPSFSELLQVAKVKQFEPVVIQKKKKEDERLLTKKERKIYEEEQERLRRKQERLERGQSILTAKSSNQPRHSSNADQKNVPNGKVNGKKPVVVHVEKDSIPVERAKYPNKFSKVPTDSRSTPIPKTVDKNRMPSDKFPKSTLPPKAPTNHDRQKVSKGPIQGEKTVSKQNMHIENKPLSRKPQVAEKLVQKKSAAKVVTVTAPAPAPPVIDTDAIAAAIEKRLRERLEKEMEEKFAAKFATMQKSNPEPSASNKSDKLKPTNASNGVSMSVNGKSHVNGKVLPKLPPITQIPGSRKGGFKVPIGKPGQRLAPPPAKKPFHPNPYLDPPRRRLEPLRPTKPIKRRIESDDEDDDEDMHDFIDDGPSQNDEDYSAYIKEIFGYDKNNYLDDDDDDIKETSFAEQMKEETRSAKLGYLEDLEEERKLREMEKKRKQKMKK